MRNCLAGDRSSFDVLVQRYQKVIYNLAMRMLNDPDDALDAAQSAFVKAYGQLRSFDPTHRFFSWLYRIAINESSNLRARRRTYDELTDHLVARGLDPAQQLAAKQLEQLVGDALQQLPPAQREVIVLHHFSELSYRQIAEVLELPEKTVKSRLFEARRHLADLLAAWKVVR